MKNMSNEGLLLLANAQESMRELSNRMEQWNESHLNIEKHAYESMNISDQVLNLSREGNQLLTSLQEQYNRNCMCKNNEECLKLGRIMDEVKKLFGQIEKVSYTVNDISHKMEEEIAIQKELGEGIQLNLDTINEGLETSVAYAELMFSEE